jgi:hypothetical protein
MAETVTFGTLLTDRIGLSNATRNAIQDQGVTTLEELADLDYDDIKNMVLNILKYIAPGAPAGDVIAIPYTSLKRLYAAKYWFATRNHIGLPATSAALTNVELADAMTRRKEVGERKTATKDQELTKPPKLSNFKDWVNWWELWDTYMQQMYGSADVPLSYVYRPHDTVTAEIRAAIYDDEEDRYIATTVLTGRHFQLDNKRVWNELKPLVIDGPGWVFIKSLEQTKHGRNAILTLQRQNEGENSVIIRKQKAYTALKGLAFTGPKKHWTFTQYVTAHQKAHNELSACHEAVPETKKVTDFLGGITDPGLGAGLANVYGDMAKLGSFETCQQYLSTIVASTSVHKRNLQATRGVSALGADGGPIKKPRLEAKDYPLAQWKLFSPAEQSKIRQLRQQKKAKRKPPPRQAAAAGQLQATQLQLPPLAPADSTPPAGAPPIDNGNRGGQAGNQFGRAAHGAGSGNANKQ